LESAERDVYAIRPLTASQEEVLHEISRGCFPDIWLDVHGARLHIVSNVEGTIEALRDGYHFFETGRAEQNGVVEHLFSLSSTVHGYDALATSLFPSGPIPRHMLVPLSFGRVYCVSSSENLHYLTGSLFTALVESLLFDRYLIVHGAAVAREEGLVLPGALRCGKTTLAFSLLQSGFRLASDDVVLVHRKKMEVHPFPRLLNLRAESLVSVPELNREYPNMSVSTFFGEPRWFLDKTDAVADPFQCRYVVFPSFGAKTRLDPIPRAEAALELLRHCFFPITPLRKFTSTAENLPSIAALLVEAESYRLVQRDPQEGVSALSALVA
jgi:hypothetical protein